MSAILQLRQVIPFWNFKKILWGETVFGLYKACNNVEHVLIEELSTKRFSIESRKTKAKVITTTNQKKGKYPQEPWRSQSQTKQTA